MSTLVLEVKFIDDTQSVDKEFTDLTALSVWLHGQRESDFNWLCLHDINNDYVFEGWSDILQYIKENTGPKSSCIALREAELNLPVVDVGASDLPSVERFGALPDGTLFYLAQTYAYGSRQKYQKTLEDGGDHNAVWDNDPNTTARIRDNFLVIRVGDKV